MKMLFAAAVCALFPVTASAAVHVGAYTAEFGMSGAAIQAAIDAAFAAHDDKVICDAGSYTATSPLYLDPPGNLRANLTNPVTSSFSMGLVGAAGDSDQTNGCLINFTFGNQVALWVGPGRGMTLDGIYIAGPTQSVLERLSWTAGGVGVGIAGGASRTLIRNVSVNGFYTGIETGANGVDALADSNTIDRVNITATVGVRFALTNNLINSVNHSVIDAVVSVEADPWSGVLIDGGNFSTPDLTGNTFPFSSVSVQTTQQGFNQAAYAIQITGTVGSMDGYIQNGGYNAFSLVTQHFGIVPMELQNINPSTGVATFLVLDHYSSFYFGGWNNDPAVKTNLVAELQAAGTLYAAIRATTLKGLEVRAKGVHVENGSVPTTLIDGWYGTEGEGGAHNSLDDIYINGDLTDSGLWPFSSGTTSAQKAQYYIARSFPQLRIGYTETSISNLSMDPTDERLIVDFFNPNAAKLSWHGAGPKLNLRTSNSGFPFTNNSGSFDTVAFGAGEYQDNPFYAATLMSDADVWRGPWGRGKVPMRGLRPDPTSRPIITPSQLLVLTGTLPPITIGSPSVIGYPLLWGGQVYGLSDWYLGAQPNYQVVSNHHFYSYGQSLPVSWSHIGQSAFLYVSDTRLLFPGLQAIIDNGDGSGLQVYLITGVYPQLGYVTVLRAVEFDNGPWLMLGDKGTVFNGMSINQEPFSVTRF